MGEKATFGCLKIASFGSLMGRVPEGRERSFNSGIFILAAVLNSGRLPKTFLLSTEGALDITVWGRLPVSLSDAH